MNQSIKEYIKVQQSKAQAADAKESASDAKAWKYYLSIKEAKFSDLVKKCCEVSSDGTLRLTSIIDKVDLSKVSPLDPYFLDLFFNKDAVRQSYNLQEKILSDFLSYCQQNGLQVKGYWYSAAYSGSGI